MAITVAPIAAAQVNTTSNGTQSSASFTPVANRLYLLSVQVADTGAAPAVSISTTTGLTFVSIATVAYSTLAAPQHRLSVYRAMKPSGLAAGTITNTGTGNDGTTMVLLEVQGMDTSGTDGSGAIVTSNTANLDTTATNAPLTMTAASSSNNRFVAMFGHHANEATNHDSADGYTELADLSFANPVQGTGIQWHATSAANTTINATWTSSSRWSAIGVQIKAAGASATPTPTTVNAVTAIPTPVVVASGAGITRVDNTAEGGTDNLAVTVGNSGGASGTAWDVVETSSGTITFDNAHVLDTGSMAYRSAKVSGVGTLYVEWDETTIVGGPDFFFRGYFWFSAAPSPDVNLITAHDAAVPLTPLFRVYLTSTGKLDLVDQNNASIATSTTTVTTSTWWRIEIEAHTSGNCELDIYSLHSTTPTETLTGTAEDLGATNFDRVRIGSNTVGVSSGNVTFWFDDIAVDDAAIGPSGTGNTLVIPTTVNAVAAIPTPATVAGHAVAVTATPVFAVAAMFAPTVLGRTVVTATTVLAVDLVFTPVVSGTANVTPTMVAAVTAIATPVVTAGASITPVTVAAITDVPRPIIVSDEDVTNVSAETVAAVVTVPGVSITVPFSITPATVAVGVGRDRAYGDAGWGDEPWGEKEFFPVIDGVVISAQGVTHVIFTTNTVTAVTAIAVPTVVATRELLTVAAVVAIPTPTVTVTAPNASVTTDTVTAFVQIETPRMHEPIRYGTDPAGWHPRVRRSSRPVLRGVRGTVRIRR